MSRLFFLFIIVYIAKASSQTDGALAIGDSLYALGNYDRAITYYEKAPSTSIQKSKIAKTYKAKGNNKKALQYYKDAVTKNPDAVISVYNYGKLALDAGKLTIADSVFELLSKKYPNNLNYTYQKGLVQEAKRDSMSFMTFMFIALKDSTHLNAAYKVARRLVTKRNFNNAMPYIERGLEADPESIRFLTLKALVAYYSKNYHLSIKIFEKLLSLNQSNEQLHENLAISYVQTNQFENAIEQYTILINEFNDKSPSWHFALGNAYSALRYFDKAIRHIEIALVLQDVSLEREYLALATIYKRQKDYKLVFEMMQKAVGENPSSDTLQYQLAISADTYFEDKASVISYYERYISKFGEKGNYIELAKQRVSDLKNELHLSKD
ncbi:tetratricopeptide repeat protein [Patiriisocius hiemis]|uniref:Tetratricopeptide repeat protein n=1 Tax=Patiriisocius hiemis TaxID=3075604 RepID=A0ABU2YDV2_9FLAO|nr:tetratricopeptide repeat protein [Constantimarinum sp. W242]MDT0556353.1 tetratricopeptide repeat protein [Constantimarinum sp. W242]